MLSQLLERPRRAFYFRPSFSRWFFIQKCEIALSSFCMVSEHDKPLDGILQLANIARPRRLSQKAHRLVADGANGRIWISFSGLL